LLNCKSIRQLSLKANKLGDNGIARMASALEGKVSMLDDLNLSKCDITKTGLFFLIKSLRNNQHLHTLTLDFNNLESNQPFYVIGKMISSGCKL